MDAIFKWIGENQLLCGGALIIVVSYAARALPPPEPGNDKFYRWLFNFAQLLLANRDKVVPFLPKKSPVRHWLDDKQDFKP
jgi:hypothetical protein